MSFAKLVSSNGIGIVLYTAPVFYRKVGKLERF
jgi:hypothetical protein